MTTLVERQVELEYESVALGAQRYEDHRREQGESSTKPGEEQTRRAVPALALAIELFIETKGMRAGRGNAALPYLVNIDPTCAAYLTVRYALDAAASRKRVNSVAIEIGSAVQNHINLLSMKDDDSGDDEVARHQRRLYAKVMEQVKKATTARHRNGVWAHVLKKYRPEHLKWGDTEKLHVGTKLIELFEGSCGLIRLQRQTEGRNDTPIYVVFTEEAEAWFKDAHERASLWFPVHQPMLVQPRPWESPFKGGYLTKAMRARMVVSHSRGYLDELKNVDMPAVYAAINAIQDTPWRVNKAVLAVAQEARAAGERFQALLAKENLPVPLRPADVPADVDADALDPSQRESLMAWKRKAAIVHEENAARTSDRASAFKKLGVAQKFADDESIWFPMYADFRGRMYYFANYLNPQGDDLARGLLQFAEGKPLGERGAYWLKVHIANLFGIDKVSFEERVQWTDDHIEGLLAAAAAPLEYTHWTVAENPWQALAACFELAGWTVEGDTYVSHLPIAMDGSCSGLQHYSAMLRDPIGGAAVNLVPAGKPGDIYIEVAKRAQGVIDASHEGEAAPWKGDKVVRKIAKQPTMTYCYSATQFGMGKQVMKAVDGLGGEAYLGEGVNVKAASVYIAGVVRDAIGETVVAAKTAMEFLQSIARLAAEKGLPIRWTAPSGFPVAQEYRESIGQRIDIHYQGIRLRLTVRKDGEKLDKKRQASGVAPNVVHSLDASHMVATVNLGGANEITSWACVHDSFGTHAADVDTLNACIREAFIEQYTPDVLEAFRAEIIEQLQVTAPELVAEIPDVPQMGTLDLNAVRDAAYFFA